jgi:hypothetical protein
LEGSVSRAWRTSWVGMVMRGVRCCSMLVVYLAPRLNTSDDPEMAVAVGELGPSLR